AISVLQWFSAREAEQTALFKALAGAAWQRLDMDWEAGTVELEGAAEVLPSLEFLEVESPGRARFRS
ncbi:MAG: hypothetical protein AB1758_34105, partial [Candidatus Eremiobacterota bacterium]